MPYIFMHNDLYCLHNALSNELLRLTYLHLREYIKKLGWNPETIYPINP